MKTSTTHRTYRRSSTSVLALSGGGTGYFIKSLRALFYSQHLLFLAMGLAVLLCAPSARAQSLYLKRVLFYGPSAHGSGGDVRFVNEHSDGPLNPGNPPEFKPVSNLPGESAIWDEQQWVNAAISDFQQFDVIVISDKGVSQTPPNPNWPAALATRAIWGSAINGNIFITSGDPMNDGASLVFRQGLRFAAAQAGNAHGRTGLYIALDHTRHGEMLGSIESPTEISILSWFGSFRAVALSGNTSKFKGWRMLGVLSGGSGAGLSSQALSINDVGLIVGWSRTTTTGNGNPKAVVWENYQSPAASDLNLKIPVADRPNWSLQYATGINASGKIVGYGLKNGSQRAFLLTPIP